MRRWLLLPRRRPYAEFLERNAGFADDLIASEAVPVTRLTTIFRQAARSLIVQRNRP